MASSGSFNTSAWNGNDGARYLTFAWTEQSQSIENNTTTISWTLKGGGSNPDWVSARNFKLTIDGKTVYSSASPIELEAGDLVASGTYTFTHNADGTRSFEAYAEAGIYVWAVNCTGRQTFALDTIPRTSSFSVSNASADMGAKVTFTISRASSSFTHKLTLTWGGVTSNIATSVGTSYEWTIPLSLANDLPSSTSSGCIITCITYSGSTEIGRKTLSMTLKVPTSVVPTISAVSMSEATSGLASKFGFYVQNKSRLKVAITAAGAYKSTITVYSTKILGVTYTGSTITSGILTSSGTVSVAVTVTDSRGRTATTTKSVSVTAYSPPQVTQFTAQRCNSDGTANNDGVYVKCTIKYTITALSNKNDKSHEISYKAKESASYTSLATSSASYTLDTSWITAITFSEDQAFDFKLTISDYFGSISVTASVETAFTLTDYHSSGTGMAIGKVSETANLFEVALESQFDKTVVRRGNGYAASSPGTAGSAGYVRIARLTHTKANADTPITFIFTQRLKASPMIVHVQFASNSTTVDPALTGITYEGSNYGAFLVKATASVWDLYVQKVSAYDTVTLNGWFSSATIDDRLKVTFPGDLVSALPSSYYRATPTKLDSLLDHIYPVDSIYLSYSHTSPAELFGGTWTRIENRFLWGTTSGGTIGGTGGSQTHTLTVNEMPRHRHTVGSNALASNAPSHDTYFNSGYTNASANTWWVATNYEGGGAAHNNMPPYIQVSVWRRTA